MKRDAIFIAIIFVLLVTVLYFAKTGAIKDDEYDIYKEAAEIRFAVYRDSINAKQARLVRFEQNISKYSKIDTIKIENLKIMYVERKKGKDAVLALDTSAAVRFYTNRIYQEYNR